MTNHYSLMIPGAQHSSNRLNVHAPFDGQLIATLETANHAAVEKALATAQTLFQDRSRCLSIEQRADILAKTARLMEEQSESLALEAAREGGKPLQDSRVEVARAIGGVRNCIECLRSDSGREITMGQNAASAHRLAFTQHE
ncbi:MAG: aldehyde dehydrogenase family protein, partial [Pseudomonadota bacterium]|nr:aldehyde dehydrogenase family protein [Pseudomonadota bacterium]